MVKRLIETMKRRGYTYAEAFFELSVLGLFEYEELILEELDLYNYPCTDKDLKILGLEN